MFQLTFGYVRLSRWPANNRDGGARWTLDVGSRRYERSVDPLWG